MTGTLPNLEGLNARAALARVGGDEATYLKLLRRFLEQAAVPQNILQHMADHQWLEAERLAHTLKGLAGSLGAEKVQLAAEQLERAIRQRPAPSEQAPLVAPCQAILDDFLARLAQQLGPAPQARAECVVDPAELCQLLQEMDRLLDDFDARAGELFESRRSAFPGALSEGELAGFEQLLANYDFSQARQLLRQAAASRDIGWP